MRTLCSLICGILAGAFLTSSAAGQVGWEPWNLPGDQDRTVGVCTARTDTSDHICILVRCDESGSFGLQFDTSAFYVGDIRLIVDEKSFPISVVDQPPKLFEYGTRAASVPAGLIEALKSGKVLTIEGTPDSGLRVGVPLKNAEAVLKRLEQQCAAMTAREAAPSGNGLTLVKKQTAAGLQGLPRELRDEVERIRRECAALYSAYAPSSEMQGVQFIRLEDRPAILVDNLALCNDHVPGANCSNRGCDLSLWRQDNGGAWHNVFKEHLYAKRLHIDQRSGRLHSMEVDLYAGHAWCKPKPGKIHMSSETCHLIIRYTGGEWTAQRIPTGRAKPRKNN